MIVSCYKRDGVMGGGGIQENDNGGNVEVETMAMAMAMVRFGLLFKNAILPLDGLVNTIVMSIGGGSDNGNGNRWAIGQTNQ